MSLISFAGTNSVVNKNICAPPLLDLQTDKGMPYPLILFTICLWSSGYMRNETTYADTNQTITHTTVSTTSTLYITYNGQLNAACNFDSGEYQAWVILANTSGTKIANTTDDIMWAFTDDVDHASNPTWDFMHGVTHTWRVASGDRPTPDSGTTYTFDIWGKIREYDDGGATYNQGSMICMEIEE